MTDTSLPDEEERAHPLLAALNSAQELLINLVFDQAVRPGFKWPVYDYVFRSMRRAGYGDAAQVLLSFPTAENRTNPSLRYRHFFTAGNGGAAQRGDAPIHLTVAGLWRADGVGPVLAQFIVGMIRVLARWEGEIEPDPYSEVSRTFDLARAVRAVPGFQELEGFLPLFASVIEHEVPLWGSVFTPSQDGTTTSYLVDLRSDLTAFDRVDGVQDYLDRLLEVMGSNRPVSAAPKVDVPLALIDEIGYLDAVWQARTRRSSLFAAAQVASCARLALDCASPEEFDTRMHALYDVLDRVVVPLPDDDLGMKGRSGSLQRLQRRLEIDLPEEDQERVRTSIRLLQAAISIRAAVHTGRRRGLMPAYDALDLRFPPSDYGLAWDHIRGRCAWAIRSIRQALEALPQDGTTAE